MFLRNKKSSTVRGAVQSSFSFSNRPISSTYLLSTLCQISLLISSFSSNLSLVNAEIYDYDLRLAQPKSLEISHSMSVAGHFDVPGDIEVHDDLKLVTESLRAGTKVRSLVSESAGKKNPGLHLVVVSADDVPRIDKDHFCCNEADVSDGSCPNTDSMRNSIILDKWTREKAKANALIGADMTIPKKEFIFSVPLQDFSKSINLPVYQSGLYYLGLVNCGNLSYDDERDGVTGRIFVKSSHGYLPAVDIPAMHFNQLLIAVYSGVGAGWIYLCFKWRSQLVSLHYSLTVLLGLTWLATVSRYSVYSLSNISEVTVGPSEIVAEMLQVAKFCIALCTGVAVSLGWGTVHDSLGASNVWSLTALGGGYLLAAAVRILILWNYDVSAHLWHSGNGLVDHLGSLAALVILPEGLMFALLVSWARGGLNELQNSLSETRQAESLKTLNAFVCLVKTCIVGGIMLLVTQVCTESYFEMADRWSLIWLFDEGGPNGLFLLIMIGSLWLFMPQDNYKLKCTSQQLSLDEAELDEMVGVEMGELETSKKQPDKFLE